VYGLRVRDFEHSARWESFLRKKSISRAKQKGSITFKAKKIDEKEITKLGN
jgi:hypothetical protein